MDSHRFQILAVVAILVIAVVGRTTEERRLIEEEEEAAALRAAKNAKYHFSSDVQDGISDLILQREETRNGLDVKGFYVYSDGYEKRRVDYEADENGFRITKEEVEKLPGPKVNQTGVATVDTVLAGYRTNYGIQSVPVEDLDVRGRFS